MGTYRKPETEHKTPQKWPLPRSASLECPRASPRSDPDSPSRPPSDRRPRPSPRRPPSRSKRISSAKLELTLLSTRPRLTLSSTTPELPRSTETSRARRAQARPRHPNPRYQPALAKAQEDPPASPTPTDRQRRLHPLEQGLHPNAPHL